MIETIISLVAFILGAGTALFLFGRKKFIVKTNEKGETTIEPLGRPKQKMEFLPEITEKEREDIERPSPFQSFLGGFKKPASKEEEEEEV